MVLLADAPLSGRVLDAGHGEGAFLDALLKAGYKEITAYDIDPYNYSAVKKRLGSRVVLHREDYLHSSRAEKFDLVIGNPPYVSWNNLDKDARGYLSCDDFWRPLSNGEWDLLYAFLILSAEKLRTGGELIQIVPFNWFNSTYAASLRNYLASHGRFEAIVHFGEFKLFPDCYPNCIIFKWRKGSHRDTCWVADFNGKTGSVADVVSRLCDYWRDRDEKREISEGQWSVFHTPALPPGGEPWYLAPPSRARRAEAIESACRGAVSDIANVAVGVVSGFDAAFLLTEAELAALPPQERALVSRFIKARDCARYRVTSTSPFIFTVGVSTEAKLKADYPTIYRRLLSHKEKLGKRYLAKSKAWWQWATIRNLELFVSAEKKGKIFVPAIDRAPLPRFAFSEEAVLVSGDVTALIVKEGEPESPLYLLGWLCSRFVSDWYAIKGAKTGERRRYTQAYLSQIPVPRIDFSSSRQKEAHDSVVSLARRLHLDPSDQVSRTKIDELFSSLLDLEV